MTQHWGWEPARQGSVKWLGDAAELLDCGGSKVCLVRGLFMVWIEFALKDFVDLMHVLLAVIHVCKMRGRFTVAMYLDHYGI